MVHLPQAEKTSDSVTPQTLRHRTRQLEQVGNTVSGGNKEAHIVHMLQRKDKDEREKLLKEALGKELVLEIPEGDSLIMKADLSLSWFKLNKLRRFKMVHSILIFLNVFLIIAKIDINIKNRFCCFVNFLVFCIFHILYECF